ncbi:MAG TPA: MerR family transcriptional regulator [Enterococcus sp.]|nr:MerR family transcriptional regulator [Enterococcus sp.]
METFLKIKDFSQLIGVSVRTLQYYDEIDLLPPAKRNAQGHRFYNDHSFSLAFMIVSLKRMGISLEEIKQILGNKQPLGSFILEEKQRVELENVSLQNCLIQLTHLEEYLKTGREVTPEMLVLLGEGESSKELLAKVSEKKSSFF